MSLSTALVVAAIVTAAPPYLTLRWRWVALTVAAAAGYVLEVGLLRGDLGLGLAGNAAIAASAVLRCLGCPPPCRERLFTDMFLAGGAAGCALGLLHTLVPAVDPFSVSRPDLGWQSTYGTVNREAGAFAYPNNLGTFAAYLALTALILLEKRHDRRFGLDLPTGAFAMGLAAIIVSGSRSGLVCLLVGALVIVIRAPRLRVPFALATVAAIAVMATVAATAGVFGEIVGSRTAVGESFSMRWKAPAAPWAALKESPLFGSGIIPGTVDSTYFYLLGVGGIVGVGLVAAMLWFSLFTTSSAACMGTIAVGRGNCRGGARARLHRPAARELGTRGRHSSRCIPVRVHAGRRRGSAALDSCAHGLGATLSCLRSAPG